MLDRVKVPPIPFDEREKWQSIMSRQHYPGHAHPFGNTICYVAKRERRWQGGDSFIERLCPRSGRNHRPKKVDAKIDEIPVMREMLARMEIENIEKEDKSQRPIGIPAFEDKILQKALAMLLSAIYENDFHDFSHGFREKRGPHDAIKSLRDACYQEKVKVIIDADVSQFFDTMPHDWIREVLRNRVNDGKIVRFIGKWLNAGVVEKESIHYPSLGSPQGGVISPLIANVFLHHVPDEWYVTQVKPRLKGRSFLVRFADDYVIGCEDKTDGYRLMEVLPKRFEKHGLKTHPDKSKLIRFKWVNKDVQKSGNGTFEFLGFTHCRGRSRKGNWIIKRMTARKRHCRALRNIFLYCRNNKHEPALEQFKDLCSKLRGLYNYYGIRGNYRQLPAVYQHTRES